MLAMLIVLPVAPAAWRVANRLPAGTEPPNDAIHPAAQEPAAIPEEVNPSIGRIADPKKKPPAPTAAIQDR